MAHKSYSASAPGSIMLLGEHAVLANKLAVVCAVDKRLRVKLTPNNSRQITIRSDRLGNLEFELKDLKIQAPLQALQIQKPFEFVLSAISLFKSRIAFGFNLEITTEFSSVMGLGSSAAVTVAAVAVLCNWLDDKPLANETVFKIAKQAILNVQGVGSGADVAACVYGGVLSYQIAPDANTSHAITPLPLIPALTAVYCGYKTPTAEVIKLVAAAQQQQQEKYTGIYNQMHACVLQAIVAIKTSDWFTLGDIFKQHQQLQKELGTSNELLDQLIYKLSALPEILGAKISGSGLGDCVIGLGNLNKDVFPQDTAQHEQGIVQFPISVAPQGILYEPD